MKRILENKIFIIISITIIFFTIIYILINFLFSYSLKLNGSDKVYLNYNETYEEKGATFNVFGINLDKKIKISNNIKFKKLGSYKVIYEVKLLLFNIRKERIVNIIDNVSPIITLTGETKSNACPNQKYKEEGYKAFDEIDGDLTDKVVVKLSNSEIIYEVSDSYGNKEKVTRQIASLDETAPILSLKGSQTIYMRKGSKYNEFGYNVSDNCDTNVRVEVSGNIDTNNDGTYTLIYTAIDSSGNKTSLKRNVVVYTDDKIGIVYLTFDDGPSGTGSTEKILNILKAEGIKATFFVTGNGPDYLIKREYDEGHTVALHTNTHDYSRVYSSVDNYYSDLNTVRNRVYNITGVYSNIIRFPGGSNNTVSNRYYGGIMNILIKDVLDKGYTYFDWNVSSGDAGQCTTSDCVYNNVINGLSKNRINVVLMHDIKMFTANALQNIIDYCKSNGFEFEAITEKTPPVRFQ